MPGEAERRASQPRASPRRSAAAWARHLFRVDGRGGTTRPRGGLESFILSQVSFLGQQRYPGCYKGSLAGYICGPELGVAIGRSSGQRLPLRPRQTELVANEWIPDFSRSSCPFKSPSGGGTAYGRDTEAIPSPAWLEHNPMWDGTQGGRKRGVRTPADWQKQRAHRRSGRDD